MQQFRASLLVVLVCLPFSSQLSECLEPRDKGDNSCGEAGGLRFYFDTRTRRCQPFIYDGCNGNQNRFKSADECRDKCTGVSADDADAANNHGMVLPVPKCPGGVRAAVDRQNEPLKCDQCPENHECIDEHCCPNKEAACDLTYDTGKYAFQGSHTPRYFYSRNINNCLLFTYYGTGGNSNNFENYKDCIKFCRED
ncbi:Kunitz/Bovine pancreatic trypsin inhibitor domain protein [Aphelenchoides besseyi]|nr:Kunitz/Bovine pancreatic trypsin inhibitor domain protein [Aphelenchoides besseyi]KAI6200697.1 Kunitz/Bovine pancreatic trypsin inhibitor domain protein [Aphelenchoides besseyi]